MTIKKTKSFPLTAHSQAALLLLLVSFQAACAQTQPKNHPQKAVHTPTAIIELAEQQNINILTKQGFGLLGQGRAKEAEQVFQQALTLMRKAPRVTPALRLNVLHGLGTAQLRQQEYGQAEQAYGEAKSVYDKSGLRSEGWHVLILGSLAQAYRLQDKLDLAEPCYKEALAIDEKILGPSALDTATTKCDLAVLCHEIGHDEEAEEYLVEALPVMHNLLGPTNANYVGLVNLYRQILSATGHAPRVPGVSD